MIFRYLLSCFCLLLPTVLHGQAGRLTGALRDAQQQPLPFANVVLLTAPDSVFVQGTTTDLQGNFQLDQLPPRAYVLRLSAVGYAPARRPVTLTSAQPRAALGVTVLATSPQALQEVVVTGRPPLLQVEGDKLIVNVAASATQAGLNGLEVLAKVPGVTINRSTEQVSLRNQSPLILLDGRPTHLTAEQLTQLLKTMRSDEIATIEVIQNPSARYEAAGTAGILNIRTKKAQRYGTLYVVQAGGAYGYFANLGGTPQHNESLTLSQRGRRGSVYAAVSNSNAQSIREQWRDQQLFESGQPTEQRRNDDRSRDRLRTQRLTVNAEWYLSARTTLNGQAQHTWSTDAYQLQGRQQSHLGAGGSYGLDTDYQRQSQQRYLTGSAQLVHRFDTLGRQLTVSLDAARLANELRSTFAYRTYALAAPEQVAQTNNQLDSPFLNPIYTGKADYVHPTRSGQRWELGAQLTRTDNRNTFASDFVGGQRRQEYFRLLETIGATYGQWSGQWLGYHLQAGLRAEHTTATGRDEQGLTAVSRRYLNVFPSASFARKLGQHQQLTLAYSRRIDRPNYSQYSPFQRFTGRLEYTQGNAQLPPFLTHSLSLRHVWKDAIVTTLSYDRATQVYSAYYTLDPTTVPGETLIRTSFTAAEVRQVAWYNLSGSVPLDPTPWLHLDLSYWYAYRVYQARVNGASIDTRVPAFGGEVTAGFTLPRAVVLEVAADANSGVAMGAFERSRPAVQVDFGVRKTFAQKRGTLKLNLTDPFDLNRYKVRIASPEVQAFNQSRWTNRLLRLQFTYSLGNTHARTSSRDTGVQESSNRSGSGL
ncbi:MAG: outer membrane beta-barrel protein [Hymenobacter sp.]|nr:outer membrane beta-barrel protein [Hymenobacter sp.]